MLQAQVDFDLRRIADLLQRTDLFSSIELPLLERLALAAEQRVVEAGTVIIKQGEFGDEVYLLLEGSVDIVVEFDTLGPIRISEAHPFDIVGETGALCQSPRSTSVVARETLRLLSIDRAALTAVTSHHPEFALGILQRVGERLHRAGRHLACLISAARALREGSATFEVVASLLRADEDFAPYAGAIEALASQIAHNQAIQREMESAAKIQGSILPRSLNWGTSTPFAEVAASMRPARHVGGDFYDYFLVEEHRLAIVVGDVSGKGVPAALFMALARNAFRLVARAASSPAEVLTTVNKILCEGNDALLFLTAVYAELHRDSGQLIYAVGGHDVPLLLRHGGLTRLITTDDMALGVEDSLTYKERREVLEPGDRVLIYTDGVTEAQNQAQDFFGLERLTGLLGVVSGPSAPDLIEAINHAVDEFASGCTQADDVTTLALEYIGPRRDDAEADPPEQLLALTGSADLARIGPIVEQFALQHGIPELDGRRMALALDELAGNTFVHGYGAGGPAKVVIRLRAEHGDLAATMMDWAPPFNPLDRAQPQIDASLEERSVGGLGIHLARELLDEIAYHHDGSRNILTLRHRSRLN